MKTFLIQAASLVYGGQKFWAESIKAESEQLAKSMFYKKYGITSWIRKIEEVN